MGLQQVGIIHIYASSLIILNPFFWLRTNHLRNVGLVNMFKDAKDKT